MTIKKKKKDWKIQDQDIINIYKVLSKYYMNQSRFLRLLYK